MAINTKHLCCITLDQSKCLPEYLHAFFLYHPESKKYLSQTTKGAIMGGLNMEIIRRLPLKLPPLTIQEEYVRRLGKIAQARAWVSSGETLADELFNSIQSRAFVQS